VGRDAGVLAEWLDTHPDAVAPHNVHIVSNEAFQLGSSDAVRMLVGAMSWVDDESNSVSLAQVGILYHQHVLCDGMSAADILGLAKSKYNLPEALTEHREALAALPLVRLAYTLYDVLQMERMEGQAAWLQSFFDMVKAYATEKNTSLSTFLKDWNDSLSEKTIPSGEAEGIVCMTIHKSKGLEFHSVIIPFCNWDFERKLTVPTLWVETNPDDYEGMPCLPIMRYKDMGISDFAQAYREETKQIWMDNMNLLYVAFTRPKRNLIVIKKATKKADDKTDKPQPPTNIGNFIDMATANMDTSSMCAAELDFRRKSAESSTQTSEPPTTDHEENPLLPVAETLGVGFHAAPLSLPFRQSNTSKTYINRGDDSPMSEFIEHGNLMHEVFARIRVADDVPAAVDELFTQGIINATQRDDITHAVSEAVQQPGATDWFSGKYELFNECTILVPEDGEVKTTRPDRVMRSEEKTIVVDFKFAQPHEKHHKQVSGYMDLLRQMGFKNVEGYLWYVEQKNIVRV